MANFSIKLAHDPTLREGGVDKFLHLCYTIFIIHNLYITLLLTSLEDFAKL